MGIHCEIEGRILRVTAEGEYSLREVRAALDAAIAIPGFEAPMVLLADATESRANPPSDEVHETALYLGTIRDHFLPTWILVSGLVGLSVALSLVLLPRCKGAFIAMIWALRANSS